MCGVQVEVAGRGWRGAAAAAAGRSRQCVPARGQYTLTPRGCHLFQPPAALLDLTDLSADEPPVTLLYYLY